MNTVKAPKIIIESEPKKGPDSEKRIDPKIHSWRRTILWLLAIGLLVGPVLNQVWHMSGIDILYWISHLSYYSLMLVSGIYLLVLPLLNIRLFYLQISVAEKRREYIAYIYLMIFFGLTFTIIGGALLLSQLLLIANGCVDLDISCSY